MSRVYYFSTIDAFLTENDNAILGKLAESHQFTLEEPQKLAWITQIQIMKNNLANFREGCIFFEYKIPRIGKRVDAILLIKGVVYVIEFKVGSRQYHSEDLDQVFDYALDLKNFHKESMDLAIVPILVATEASEVESTIHRYDDNVLQPIKANHHNIGDIIIKVSAGMPPKEIDINIWQNSPYKPTPTIVEAAQAFYRNHSVTEISHSDAEAINLTLTTDAVIKVIEQAKKTKQKYICFITGVPGAGKTLAGLNIVAASQNLENDEHAVFLSGNGPLVSVLCEALARDDVDTARVFGKTVRKTNALRKAKTLIQNIHHFRDESLDNESAPPEKVVVFDEAQRAWTAEQTASFMKRKRGKDNFKMSEPEFLISVMDRHADWAVIVCLVGGGQEINTGEAGLPAWLDALKNQYPNWHAFSSNRLSKSEYTHGRILTEMLNPEQLTTIPELHLAVSQRSFRTERVSELIQLIIDNQFENARAVFAEVQNNYPILITRDLQKAKGWLKNIARGTERYGILASSGAIRLKAVGVAVQLRADVTNWFLNSKSDVRSSYYLEDVATEFDVQGLELDYTCVCWDANFRYLNKSWIGKDFKGTTWRNINDQTRFSYLKNAYRVLLTRARQGMVIFLPLGDTRDNTRLPEYFDGTYAFLKEIGFKELT